MKNPVLCLLLLSLFGCVSRDGFVVKGYITNNKAPVDSGIIYLFNGDLSYADTTQIVNGKFTFSGKVTTPDLYYIMVEGSRAFAQIFLENDRFSLEASLDRNMKDIKIEGGENQALFSKETEKEREIGLKYQFDALNAEYQNPETPQKRKDEILEIFNKIKVEVKEYRLKLMDEYPSSYFTLKNILGSVDQFSFEEASRRLAVFQSDSHFAGNEDVKAILKAIEQMKLIQPGMKAPDFSIPDRDGNITKFSDICKANKITLLDFWASWCAPCRKAHPYIKEIYAKYHSKGLEIFAVSFDSSRDKWLEAIEEDGLPWLHFSDVRHWNSVSRDLYLVTYVPQYVLVDSKGIILKRKISESEIAQYLESNIELEHHPHSGF